MARVQVGTVITGRYYKLMCYGIRNFAEIRISVRV